jgi:8-oxo-dGTP diphosphatase
VESVRRASAADRQRLDDLWRQADEEISPHRGGALLVRGTGAPPDLPTGADRLVALGYLDAVPLGFVSAHVAGSQSAPSLAVVDAIFVQPEARGIGLGEALVDEVVAWAASQGCEGIDIPALPGNRQAKAFCEDNGFVARLLTMHRSLPPRSAVLAPPAGLEAAAGLAQPVVPAAPARPRPAACVGAVAVDGGRLLLIRRGRGAAAGTWSIPGGRVEGGETLAEAVLRELREETALDALCGESLGWVERIDDDHHFVIFDFIVTVISDTEPVAGDDAAEVAWVLLADVVDLNLSEGLAEFLHEHGILPTIA